MHLQFRVDPLDKKTAKSIFRGFKNLHLDVELVFLKNNSKQEDWDDSSNGMQITLGGKVIFKIQKQNAELRLKKIPLEKQERVLQFIQKEKLAKKPSLIMGISLTIVFLAVAFFIVLSGALERSETLAIALLSLLGIGFAGIAIIAKANYKVGGNAMATVGFVMWLVGMIGFAPSSLLTIPFVTALRQRKFPTNA